MQKQKILITGSSGYFGSILSRFLSNNYEIIGVDVNKSNQSQFFECDLTNKDQVKTLSGKIQPEVIIHVAGIKDISFCERFPDLARSINYETTNNILQYFGNRSKIIYISTDYVFDGEKGNYAESDIPRPRTTYGKTKLMGEQIINSYPGANAYVVRTAAIFDKNASFLKYLEQELSKGNTVTAFSDATYSPTWIRDFNNAIIKLIENDYNLRTLHICGKKTTRYEFARKCASVFGYSQDLIIKGFRPLNKYLFRDLSLNASQTNNLIEFTPTPHEIALFNCK